MLTRDNLKDKEHTSALESESSIPVQSELPWFGNLSASIPTTRQTAAANHRWAGVLKSIIESCHTSPFRKGRSFAAT